MDDHTKGLLITTLGVLFVVPDALFVRLIASDPLTTAFGRAFCAGVILLPALFALQGWKGFRAVLQTGWLGLLYTLLISFTAPGFVMAVSHTSVANVVFIFATIPIFATLFSRLFLEEGVSLRIILTIAAVLIGLGIIAYGSQNSQIASWRGDVWALAVAGCYAGALTVVRRIRSVPMVPAIPFAFFISALIVLPFGTPAAGLQAEWPLFAAYGFFIAVATCLLSTGPRYISSAEVGLLLLLESVLAPLLVWAWVGEDPGRLTLLGGAVVIGALLVSNLVLLRRRRRQAQAGS